MSVAGNEDFQLVEVDPSSPSRYPMDSRKGSFTGFSVDTNQGWIKQPVQESDRFFGEWKDSLGHHIFVFEAPTRRGADQKFFAVLSRPFSKEKTLAIRCDQQERWICGNGYLDGSKSTADFLVWETEDGRISEWKRIPPNGPVFFDPPPYLMKQFATLSHEAMKPRGGVKIIPSLVESSQQCHVDEATGQLLWRLQDEWDKLKKFPSNCCITSPTFSSNLGDSDVMQIVFYPTGQHSDKTAVRKPSSVLSLTREAVDLAGLKVEFFINGTSLGTKVCHGRRTDLDVMRPPDDTIEVVISVALHRK